MLLGHLLAGLGRLLREFRLPEISKTWILEGLGTSQARFWRVWGSQFDILFAAHCALLSNVFLSAVATLLHLPSLFLLPFWCGGLCAAHPPPPEGMPSVPDSRYKLPNVASKAYLKYKKPSLKGLS